MEKQLTCVLNGITYLLFEIPHLDSYSIKKTQEQVRKYAGILQGAERISGGFFGQTVVMVRALIPENRALEFSNEP